MGKNALKRAEFVSFHYRYDNGLAIATTKRSILIVGRCRVVPKDDGCAVVKEVGGTLVVTYAKRCPEPKGDVVAVVRPVRVGPYKKVHKVVAQQDVSVLWLKFVKGARRRRTLYALLYQYSLRGNDEWKFEGMIALPERNVNLSRLVEALFM